MWGARPRSRRGVVTAVSVPSSSGGPSANTFHREGGEYTVWWLLYSAPLWWLLGSAILQVRFLVGEDRYG